MNEEPRPGCSKERSGGNNNNNTNPFGISNVVQRTTTTTNKGAARKNARGKHFLPTPSATQKRIDDFYRKRPEGTLFSTKSVQSTTTAPKDKETCRIPGPVGKFHLRLAAPGSKVLGGGSAVKTDSPLTSSRRRPTGYKPPTHIQSRQKMSRKFKKKEQLQAALYSVDQDCWLQLYKHLQTTETEIKSVTDTINIQWIHENWNALKDGKPIPILVALILKWTSKASRNINSGQILRIADFTGIIHVVINEKIATAYESILTPGTAIILSNIRLQVYRKESLVVVPRNGLVLVATKAKLDTPLLMGRHTMELGNGVSTVGLNHFDYEDALLRAQSMVAELNDKNADNQSTPDVVIIESDDDDLDWGDDNDFNFVLRNMKKEEENSLNTSASAVVVVEPTPQVITIEDDEKKQEKQGYDKFLHLEKEDYQKIQRKDGNGKSTSSPDVVLIEDTPQVITIPEEEHKKKEHVDENLDWGDDDFNAQLGEMEIPEENDKNNLQEDPPMEPGDADWDADDGLEDLMRNIEDY